MIPQPARSASKGVTSQRIKRPCWRCGLIFVAFLAMPMYVDAAEAAWSIEKLNASEANWSKLVGTPLRVEGRLSSQIKGQIRFQKCDLTFRLDADHERKLIGAKNLEVHGRLQREGSKFTFQVDDVKTQPTDREQFHSREAALRNPTAKDLYELGDWAVLRGTFYEDQELVELGRTSEARGLGIELRDLPKEEVEGRFELAEKAVSMDFPKSVVHEIRHEGYRAWLERCLKTMPPDDTELAALEKKVQQAFPESLEPMKAWPTDLARDYQLDPQETYRLADANQRQILHRLLGADVQWHRIVRTAKPDGSNGKQIADRIDELIPERHAAAEQFRERELMYRLKGIETAPRAVALDLAASLRNRNRAELATDALRKWMQAKERRLQPDEAPQFIELADDYLTLLNDEQKAVVLLSEAHRREPQSPDVAQRFAKLGYDYDGVRWKKSDASDEPGTMAAPAMPATTFPMQLEIGMSAAQLDQLLGKASVTTIMRSASVVDEIRVYGRQGEGSRLIVQLRRGPGEAHPVVTRFDSR